MKERLLTCLVLHKPGLQRGFPFLQSSILLCVWEGGYRTCSSEISKCLTTTHRNSTVQRWAQFNPSVHRPDRPALRLMPERTLFWETSQCPSQLHNCELIQQLWHSSTAFISTSLLARPINGQNLRSLCGEEPGTEKNITKKKIREGEKPDIRGIP